MKLSHYADAIHNAYLDSVRHGCRVRHLRLAGQSIALRFAAGFEPEFILAPLARHLLPDPSATPIEPPALTVHLWDSRCGGRPPPYVHWNDSHQFRYEDFLTAGQVLVSCNLDPHRLNVLDLDNRRAFVWLPDASQQLQHERAAPLRQIFHWWLRKLGIWFVHAAAVGQPERGLLLAGNGGSGKSTTAMISLAGGFSFVADDYCALRPGSPPAAIHLYSSAKLVDPSMLAELPSLATLAMTDHREAGEKALLALGELLPERIAAELPISAVVLPIVTYRRDTVYTRAAPAAAVRALAGSSMRQLRGADISDFYGILRCLRVLPSYQLHLGRDLAQIPAALEATLAESSDVLRNG